MKTQQEILDRIKTRIANYWKNTRSLDKQGVIYQRIITEVSALCWVIYGYDFHEVCPYCGNIMTCDTVDIGIGYQQCGPYYCEQCGASEIHNSDKLQLDKDEQMTGYYKNRISPIANTCCGHLVSHNEAKRLYKIGLLDNCKPY